MDGSVDRSQIVRPMLPDAPREATHIGIDELPFLPVSERESVQLLHADLTQGLWIVRSRFKPDTTLTRHFHTGSVYAVTLKGRWHYLEYPDQVNTEGSYLFEPAGSTHTLHIPPQEGDTEVWFAIHGANLNLTEDGQVAEIIDAGFILKAYRGACQAMGLSTERLIVIGE